MEYLCIGPDFSDEQQPKPSDATVKEKWQTVEGKGGGKPQMARAMFGTADDLKGFIKAITS